MSNGIIYMATNMHNNKSYIGLSTRTLELRIQKHISDATSKRNNMYFHKALRKYGKEAFEWIILENSIISDLASSERFWIAYFKSIGAELYNTSAGGYGTSFIMSKETRKKMSIAQTGKKASLATLQKLRHSHLGKKYHNSIGRRNRIIIVEDSNFNQYNITNISEFARNHNLQRSHFSKVINGKLKSHKGFILVSKRVNNGAKGQIGS